MNWGPLVSENRVSWIPCLEKWAYPVDHIGRHCGVKSFNLEKYHFNSQPLWSIVWHRTRKYLRLGLRKSWSAFPVETWCSLVADSLGTRQIIIGNVVFYLTSHSWPVEQLWLGKWYRLSLDAINKVSFWIHCASSLEWRNDLCVRQYFSRRSGFDLWTAGLTRLGGLSRTQVTYRRWILAVAKHHFFFCRVFVVH